MVAVAWGSGLHLTSQSVSLRLVVQSMQRRGMKRASTHIDETLVASRKSCSTSDKSCVLQGCVDDAQGALCDSGHEASIRREDDCGPGLSDWVSRCEAMSVSTWLGAVTGIDVSSCRYQQKLLFGRRSLVRKTRKTSDRMMQIAAFLIANLLSMEAGWRHAILCSRKQHP